MYANFTMRLLEITEKINNLNSRSFWRPRLCMLQLSTVLSSEDLKNCIANERTVRSKP